MFFSLLVGIVASKILYLFSLVSTIIVFTFIVVTVFLFLFFNKIKIKLQSTINRISEFVKQISLKKLLLFLIIISVASKIVAIFLFQIFSIDDHSDINVYVTSSKEFADDGVVKQYAGYCFTFSHMFWFAVVLSPITKLFGVTQIAYSLFLTCLLTIVEILLFDLISFVCDKSRAFFIILVYSLLPSEILLPQYVTHEIAALFFLSFFLWLYFKQYKKTKGKIKKILVFGGSIIALLFCSAVNALGIVAIIAFFIVLIIELIRHRTKRYIVEFLLQTISLIIVILFGSLLLNIFQIQHSQINYTPQNNKILWTLYVGSNYESQGEWFKDEKWDNYPDDFSSTDIDSYHKYLINEHYKNLLHSPKKALSLLKNKMINMWGDFSYSLGLTNETIPNQNIQLFYNRFLFKPLSLINYSVLLFISLIGCYLMWKNRKQYKNEMIVFGELFLLGTTALLLITECRNKYSIIMIPIFIISCTAFINTKEKIIEKTDFET